jgi:hypothetical protein
MLELCASIGAGLKCSVLVGSSCCFDIPFIEKGQRAPLISSHFRRMPWRAETLGRVGAKQDFHVEKAERDPSK